MNSNKQTNPTVIVTNISAWLNDRYIRMRNYYIETPDGRFYLVNGNRIAANEFEDAHPINELEIA